MKTDRLCMLGIDALDERGDRLDGFHLVNKAPVSVGTDGWRLARQVFRPRRPIESLTLMLCARGANGHTLDATGLQPQNNVVGTVWWDDVRVHEPESLPEELRERGVATVLRAGHMIPRLANHCRRCSGRPSGPRRSLKRKPTRCPWPTSWCGGGVCRMEGSSMTVSRASQVAVGLVERAAILRGNGHPAESEGATR